MRKALSPGLGEPKSNPILLITETGAGHMRFLWAVVFVSVRLLGGAGGPPRSISLFLPTFLFAGGAIERITVTVKMDIETKGTTKM